jgi:SAM-dependent methyltransferase
VLSAPAHLRTRLRTAAWIARTVATDLRYGGVLAGNARSRGPGSYAVANTPYSVLPHIFAGRIRRDDTLVDVGCGKGRVINWWLSRGLRNRIVGLEIDPDVAAATRRRLRAFPNVTIVCADAAVAAPDDATLLYLYNPFDRAATERFKANLTQRFACGIRVLYWNPYWAEVFEDDPRWDVEVMELPRVSDPRIAGAHRRYAALTLRAE